MDAVQLFINAVEHWRMNKGIGTAIIPPPLNDKAMLLLVLQRFYGKSMTSKTLIVIENFDERRQLIEYLTTQEDEENNNEFKKLITEGFIKILSNNYVNRKEFNYTCDLMIILHCREIGSYTFELFIKTKFRLAILNTLLNTNEESKKLYAICPLLKDFEQKCLLRQLD